MTRCLPPSSYGISSLHVSMAAFSQPYRPEDAQLDPGTRAAMHWSRCCWRLGRPYKSHPCVDLLAAPGLQLGRSIPRRRMRGRQSGLRRFRRHSSRRATNCSPEWRKTRELWSRRVRFWGRIVWKKKRNWWERLSYQSHNCSSTLMERWNRTIVRRILAGNGIDEVRLMRSSCSRRN
jgi:hypothetical protein